MRTQPFNSEVDSADKNLLLRIRRTIHLVQLVVLKSGGLLFRSKTVMSHISSRARKIGIVSHEKKLVVVWRVLRTIRDQNSQSQQSRNPRPEQAGPPAAFASDRSGGPRLVSMNPRSVASVKNSVAALRWPARARGPRRQEAASRTSWGQRDRGRLAPARPGPGLAALVGALPSASRQCPCLRRPGMGTFRDVTHPCGLFKRAVCDGHLGAGELFKN